MATLPELVLKDSCTGCGATLDLYGSSCRHLTLCVKCGKSMAETAAPCSDCGVPITRLIREYNVRTQPVNKPHFVGRFLQGLPTFSKKKTSGTKWTLQREGLQGRQVSEALREKYKAKPWILEDNIGQQQFQGQLEGGQQATYYLLMMSGQEFLAFPAGAWYNFNKVAQYKQLTLEEAEEQMKNRRKTADGYQRWMMKAANTGSSVFADMDKVLGSGGGGGRGSRKKGGDDEENEVGSDVDEDDMDDEEARKNRLGMNKGAKGGDEDGEEPARDENDLDDEEPERGDDWEHEETFTDDDEAVGNDPEEREEQAPEGPAPPEIKQEEEDEENNQEGQQNEDAAGGLSKSGRDMKKLLGKSAGMDDSDAEDDEEDDEDVDLDNEEFGFSPVLAPTLKDARTKEELTDTTPAKPSGATGRSTPASATPSKGKRKASTPGEETKINTNKKAKSASEKGAKTMPISTAAKKEAAAGAKVATGMGPPKGGATAKVAGMGGGVSEEEAKALLRQSGPIKSQDLVAKFKSRLKTQEDKTAFAQILKKISRIQKTDGVNYIVLRDK
ncbi:unnamed protein product [Sphagnum jensenii]|uniref:Transcription initiation factor IIF subunit alpha n=1 Tax=Sphagnum jensenii TaxID=128206 RepID=A0ABP1BY10_9BRYO